MLSLHLCAPFGVYRATNILPDISEVLPGECILFTELGMSRFRYRENRTHRQKKRELENKATEIFYPYHIENGEKVGETLTDALIAFDYPQFDADMPSVCELFDRSGKEGRYELRFEDTLRSKSLSYAYERQDRLGSLFGISAVGASVRREDDRTAERDEMSEYLKERFFSLDNSDISFLRGVVGVRKLEYLMRRFEEKSKDT
jgi:hypothetical protein